MHNAVDFMRPLLLNGQHHAAIPQGDNFVLGIFLIPAQQALQHGLLFLLQAQNIAADFPQFGTGSVQHLAIGGNPTVNFPYQIPVGMERPNVVNQRRKVLQVMGKKRPQFTQKE